MIANLNKTTLKTKVKVAWFNKTRSKSPLVGFDKNMFVSDIAGLSCGICLDVFNNPHQCKIGHMFCKSCIVDYLKTPEGNSCPTCRVAMDVDNLSASLFVKNVIDKLIVTCKCLEDETIAIAGCEWTGSLAERAGRVCPFLYADCDNPGCKVVGYNLTRLKAHKKKCSFRISKCLLCKLDMPHSDLIGKHKSVCEFRIVTCVDCGVKMTCSEISVHHGEYLCEMSPYECPYRSLFGLCVPSCTGSVNQANHNTHLGECEMLIKTIFDKHLELMYKKVKNTFVRSIVCYIFIV
jgi:hypothetical protein